MAKVTIEDISNMTGLSRGTVSRALNNRPDISSITKQKVLNACKELGYSPSHAARSLATGRCFAVAVVTGNLADTFSIEYVRGVLGAAAAAHYVVHVVELGGDVVPALEALATFAAERVDGVLMSEDIGPAFAVQAAELAKVRPLIGVSSLAGTADEIAPDYFESGRLIASTLLNRARDGFVYCYDSTQNRERIQASGVSEACRAAGLDPEQTLIDVGPPAPERLLPAASRLQGSGAIAAGSDELATEILLHCAGTGRWAGRDFALAGQGDSAIGRVGGLRLTTTSYCGDEIGRRAFTLFLERLNKSRHDGPQQILVTPRLIAGTTAETG